MGGEGGHLNLGSRHNDSRWCVCTCLEHTFTATGCFQLESRVRHRNSSCMKPRYVLVFTCVFVGVCACVCAVICEVMCEVMCEWWIDLVAVVGYFVHSCFCSRESVLIQSCMREC